MSLPQGDLRLLEGDVARRLLASTVPTDPVTRMARITVRPTWVGVVDFQTRLPGPLGGVQPEAGR